MKKSIFFVIGVLTLTLLACGFNLSTANISDAHLATDEEGTDVTTVFDQADTFYAIVDVANAPDSTTVKAEWTAVDADGLEPDFVLDETEIEGAGTFTFNIENDQLWPIGDYKVDIFLNGELDRTLEFSVEGDVLAQEEVEEDPTPEPVEPTATLKPDEPATEPTATPETSVGDSLGGAGNTPEDNPEGILFVDLFDSNVNGWETGEFEGEQSINDVTIEDGQFNLTVNTIETAYVEQYIPDQEFSDFSLTLQATPADRETYYSYGVAFRVDENGNGYTFEIGNNGFYYIGLYNDGWETLVDWTETDQIRIGRANEIWIIAEGDEMSFLVNGELLETLQDDTVAEGRSGLVLEMFEEDQLAQVAFDNLVIGDSSLTAADLKASAGIEAEEIEVGPPQLETYTHPSDAFSFGVPEGWESISEDDTSALWGTFLDTQSLVGGAFTDAGFIYTQPDFQEFIDNFTDGFVGNFADNYQLIDQQGDPNDRVFVSTSYQSEDGDGEIEFLFMQRKTAVFVLYFITDAYDDMLPTWDAILETYEIDPDAALAAAPAPTPPPAPTQPPAPAGPSAPAGKGLLLFRNNTGVDFVIDVIGPTNTSQVIPPNSSFEFTLDPGQYTLNGHSPGGEYAINAYSFDLSAGQVFPLNLN